MTAAARKDARMALRLTPTQNALIRDAAATTGQSLNDFVTAAALRSAEDALADRRVFRLDDEAWAAFNDVLDRPARAIPELVALMREVAPWDQEA